MNWRTANNHRKKRRTIGEHKREMALRRLGHAFGAEYERVAREQLARSRAL